MLSAESFPAVRPGRTGLCVVGRVGLEPTTKGLCLPLRLSPPVSGSWSGLCLAFRPSRRVSTRSPLTQALAELRSALAWHPLVEAGAEAFTEFEKFYFKAERTYLEQPIWLAPCVRLAVTFRGLPLSPLL